VFANRTDAGVRLAARLSGLRGEDVVVLALPRGGVPVAFEVAKAMRAPLDVIIVRKLGVPSQRELGMGAIAEGGVRVLNSSVVQGASISDADIAAVEQREMAELQRRARELRGTRPPISLAGRVAVVIDDGIATGATARAACRAARAKGAARVILAVPVAPPAAAAALRGDADEVVCVESPEHLWAVGQWYRDFTQTTDAEVIALLRRVTEWSDAQTDAQADARTNAQTDAHGAHPDARADAANDNADAANDRADAHGDAANVQGSGDPGGSRSDTPP
jgi:putative phosphoribosyl transferase